MFVVFVLHNLMSVMTHRLIVCSFHVHLHIIIHDIKMHWKNSQIMMYYQSEELSSLHKFTSVQGSFRGAGLNIANSLMQSVKVLEVSLTSNICERK